MLSTFSSRAAGWRRSATAVFSVAFVAGAIFFGATSTNAQSFTQNFDTVPAMGWTVQNNSATIGSTGWFQGNSTVFPSQAGAGNSYIGANFNNATGTNTISNWLVSPNASGIANGHTFKYWTRTIAASPFPDRLQVRMSLAGMSTNVGTGPTGTGDFATLLRDINPGYDTGGIYPEVWTEFTETISGVAVPTSGRFAFRYFVEMGGPTGDNSNYIGIDTVSYTAGVVTPADAPVDFNADGRTDWTVVRNTGGGATGQVTWFYNLNNSANPTAAFAWGIASDEFLSEDFDNDNKDDIAVWRPGAATVAAFYIFNSATNTVRVEAFGQTGDDPSVVDDYNGDGSADLAVYRGGVSAGDPSTWYYRTAANGPVTFVQWGQNGDFPAPGDYDGNGSADFGVQRNNGGAGNFWIRLSNGTVQPVTVFGTSSDLIVPGDYDGDGKTDIAVVRAIGGAINWFWRPSAGGADQQAAFGASATDFPVPGDYNGDGRSDLGVWRSGTFYVYSPTGASLSYFTLGANGDYPIANFNTH